jgi:hypothetical protein
MNQEQLINLLKAFAANNDIPFENLMKDFQSESSENQQAFLEQVMQEMNVGEQQSQQSNPQQSQMMQEGGVPINSKGYHELDPLENPEVIIPSGDITMEGIDYDIDAYDANNGKFLKRMKPNQNYKFNTNKVLEKPVYAQQGKSKKYDDLLASAESKLQNSKNTKFNEKKRQDAFMSQSREIEDIIIEIKKLQNVTIEDPEEDAGLLGNISNRIKTLLPTNTYRTGQYTDRLNVLSSDLQRALKGMDLIGNEKVSLNELYDNNPTGRSSQASKFSSSLKGLTSQISVLPDKWGRELLGDYDLNYGLYPDLTPKEKKESQFNFDTSDTSDIEEIKEVEQFSNNNSNSNSNNKRTNTKSNVKLPTSNEVRENYNFGLSENNGELINFKSKPVDSKGQPIKEESPTNKVIDSLDYLNKVFKLEDPISGEYLDSDKYPTEEEIKSIQEKESGDKRRFLGKFDTNPPVSAFNELMRQSNGRLSEPYRGVPNIAYNEVPLIELDPIVNNVIEQEYAALQNVDTTTAAGKAYAAQIKQGTQKSVMDTSNKVNAQNSQIKSQNNLNRITAFNQEEANRVNSDRAYVDDLQRQDSIRDTMRLNARSYQDQLVANKKREDNTLTANLMNLPQIMMEDLDDGTKEAYLDTSYEPSFNSSPGNVMQTEDGTYMEVEDRNKNQKKWVKLKNQNKQTGGRFKLKYKNTR